MSVSPPGYENKIPWSAAPFYYGEDVNLDYQPGFRPDLQDPNLLPQFWVPPNMTDAPDSPGGPGFAVDPTPMLPEGHAFEGQSELDYFADKFNEDDWRYHQGKDENGLVRGRFGVPQTTRNAMISRIRDIAERRPADAQMAYDSIASNIQQGEPGQTIINDAALAILESMGFRPSSIYGSPTFRSVSLDNSTMPPSYIVTSMVPDGEGGYIETSERSNVNPGQLGMSIVYDHPPPTYEPPPEDSRLPTQIDDDPSEWVPGEPVIPEPTPPSQPSDLGPRDGHTQQPDPNAPPYNVTPVPVENNRPPDENVPDGPQLTGGQYAVESLSIHDQEADPQTRLQAAQTFEATLGGQYAIPQPAQPEALGY